MSSYFHFHFHFQAYYVLLCPSLPRIAVFNAAIGANCREPFSTPMPMQHLITTTCRSTHQPAKFHNQRSVRGFFWQVTRQLTLLVFRV
jgi:hypothetical protein